MNPTQASSGQVAKEDRLYAVAFQGYLLKDSITEDKAKALHYLEHAQAAYGANPDNYSLVDLGPGVTREMPDEASPGPGPGVLISKASRETAGEFAGHTPGPWEVAHHGTTPGNASVEVQTKSALPVAVMCYCGRAEENARLIAAAPTLLAERDSLRAQLDAATDALRQRTEQRDRLARACEDSVLYLEQPSGRLAAIHALRSALAAQGGAK